MKAKLFSLSLVTLVTLFMIVPTIVKCQTPKNTFHIDKITASEGKSAMTSGLDFVVSMSPDSNSKSKGLILMAQANNERVNIRIGKSWGDVKRSGNLTLLLTPGVFKNVPWLGLMTIYNYNNWFSLCNWTGFGMGNNNQLTKPGWKPYFFVTYQEAGFNFGKNRFAYAIQLFTTNDLNHYLVYKRDFSLGKNTGLFAETTYDIKNELPMFVIGINYSFAQR